MTVAQTKVEMHDVIKIQFKYYWGEIKMIKVKLIPLLFIAFALMSCGNQITEKKVQKVYVQPESLIVSELEKLAGGFTFTEGPAVDPQGNVFFTDIPNHLILIWTIDDKLETFKTNSGRANGLYFDKEENQ